MRCLVDATTCVRRPACAWGVHCMPVPSLSDPAFHLMMVLDASSATQGIGISRREGQHAVTASARKPSHTRGHPLCNFATHDDAVTRRPRVPLANKHPQTHREREPLEAPIHSSDQALRLQETHTLPRHAASVPNAQLVEATPSAWCSADVSHEAEV